MRAYCLLADDFSDCSAIEKYLESTCTKLQTLAEGAPLEPRGCLDRLEVTMAAAIAANLP